jgi:hypothetical protein
VEQHNLSTIRIGANKNDKNVGVSVGNVQSVSFDLIDI